MTAVVDNRLVVLADRIPTLAAAKQKQQEIAAVSPNTREFQIRDAYNATQGQTVAGQIKAEPTEHIATKADVDRAIAREREAGERRVREFNERAEANFRRELKIYGPNHEPRW